MKNKRSLPFLSAFLALMMLVSVLPVGIFAYEMPKGNSTPNYTEYRGEEGMFEDSNGVMVYYGLEDHYKTSRKDVKLSTEYKTVDDSKSTSNTSVAAYYDECPYLYVDYAIYFDESIEGTTYKVSHGLSVMDGVYYLDSATGKVVKGEKSPIELTANNSNTGNPDYNAGYTMVYGEDGELLYTTRHQNDKAILFYIINHRASERIGMEDDVSILSDYVEQGYVVITVDFKSNEQAVTPFIENALVSLRAMFDKYASDAALTALGLVTNTNNIYFLPEGCRLERDVWYWDPSIYGVSGTMERFRQTWNEKISYEATENQSLADPKQYDTLGIGSVDSVEEMILTVTKKDGTPIEYKQTMDIIYPSQPKDGYKAPLYIQEGTNNHREQNILTTYTRVTFTSFALNGYACVQYDHPYWPFLYRNEYYFQGCGGNYGLGASSAHNARAAVRCARYLASTLGYSDEYVGAAGISKATVGLAVLSIKNNKQLTQGAVTAFGVKYDNTVYEGDVLVDGTVTKEILQPFMYYDENGENEVSSDCDVVYNSSGGGVETLFKSWGGTNYAKYEKVPMVLSCGIRDEYNCYDYWEEEVEWFRDNATEPFLPITQLDQGHAYPVGYDNQFGYYRQNAMLKFFDTILKPDADRAPEVLWVTPLDGARNVPVTGEWEVGPYTPYGWEIDSYTYDQTIQIRFLSAVDPASVNSGVSVTTEGGKKLSGTWVASEQDALYTFETDELSAGTNYTINVTSGVKSLSGVALAEERTVSFKTEGTYLVGAVADTYVSASEPDTAFGAAGALKVSADYTTLVSFKAENLLEAENILLRADVALNMPLSVNVYALADTLVDGTLTYNTLSASDAWSNKALVGTYEISGGELAFDLSPLADMELGDYVTLAFVSATEATEEAFVYENDFEIDYTGGVTATLDGVTYTVVASSGVVTDARFAGDLNWTINKPSSPYIWARTGNNSDGKLVKDASISQSQVFRVNTSRRSTQIIKFFNTTTNDYLTDSDVGKVFRVTFDIYPTRDIPVTVGVSPIVAGDGSAESPSVPSNGIFTVYGGTDKKLSANTWTTVTCDVTLTQAMADMQAGLVAVQLPYPAPTADDSAASANTYFDNLRVEELTPSFDAENGAFSLITTNKGVALNSDITVETDEAMALSAFAERATVRNEISGKTVKGEWKTVGTDGKSFAFVTGGLEPASTYTVSLDGEVIRTVFTEGNYAIRPIATSYVSVSEPNAHFGLDVTPILSSDKLGVMTFSAKTLKDAELEVLYLDVDTARNTYFTVYALTDLAPDNTLCYNTVASKLTDDAILKACDVVDGKLAIDVTALADKTLGESVTLVLRAGYRFFNDFETPTLSSAKWVDAGQSTQVPENVSFSGTYIWGSIGTLADGYQMPASGTQTQSFRISTKGEQNTKFYNTLKTSLLDGNDVGRTYNVSFKMRSAESTATPVGTTSQIDVTVGFTNRTRLAAETHILYDGVKYGPTTYADTPSVRPTKTLTLGDSEWSTISFTTTVNEAMAAVQAGMLTLSIPAVQDSASANVQLYHFYDDILVEEVITDEITVGTPILMTENTATVALTDADNPVKDENVYNHDASVISYQVSKDEDGEFSIRVLSGIDSLIYKNFGYEITLTDESGTRTSSGTDTLVYTSIYGGETAYSVKENFGYEYAALATLTGLATDSASTEITVRSYVTAIDGEIVYGRGATLVYTGELDGEGYPELSVVFD